MTSRSFVNPGEKFEARKGFLDRGTISKSSGGSEMIFASRVTRPDDRDARRLYGSFLFYRGKVQIVTGLQ